MEQLLIAVSVYRAAADRNAILFQLSEHDWSAGAAPDGGGLAPPYRAPDDLDQLIASCVTAELISAVEVNADSPDGADSWIVDPWLAGQVHHQLEAVGRREEIVTAHRRAAGYWQWRAAAWPQGRPEDLRNLLEARHHLFAAGEAEQASAITHAVCAQLHAWGDLDREVELVQSTLDMLPGGTVMSADWMHELGAVYLVRREFEEARRCYSAAVEMFAALGDYDRVARGQHSLGVLAQAQGDYRRAERYYLRSRAAEKKAAAQREAGESKGGPSTAVDASAAPTPPATAADGPPSTAERPPDTAEGLADTAEGQPGTAEGQPGTAEGQPGTAARADSTPISATATPAVGTAAEAAVAMAALDGPASATGDPSLPVGLLRDRIGSIVLALGLAAAAIVVLGALLVRPGVHLRSGGSGAMSPGAVRLAAAAWVASQVSRSAVVGCDPAMCAALTRAGVPAGDLLTLGPGGAPDPLASNLVVATAALRAEFGERLTDVYAPEVLAAFGDGSAAIQVRAVAPDGAPAFTAAMHSDLQARREFGVSLLRNRHLLVSARAAAQLANGEVDSRLLAALATIADLQPLRVIAFGDAGPGAASSVPLRSVVISPTDQAGPGWAHSVLAFLEAQQTLFHPASARWDLVPGYPYALRIQYASPSPLGLLTTSGASQGFPSTHK
jgi:tetratricopeptide (TPR) repeat protein